jgi:hypothetical protein
MIQNQISDVMKMKSKTAVQIYGKDKKTANFICGMFKRSFFSF